MKVFFLNEINTEKAVGEIFEQTIIEEIEKIQKLIMDHKKITSDDIISL